MFSTLLLITTAPTTKLAYHAYKLAEAMQQAGDKFTVFFYQDAVAIANATVWRGEDQLNLTYLWQQLNIPLAVCVSAALSRGITDAENASRHLISHTNLADGFSLTGLGTLADAMSAAHHVIQF